MSSQLIPAAFRELARAADGGADLYAAWESYAKTVQENRHIPPFHLRSVINVLEAAGERRDKADIQVLEHGCGNGEAAMYLCALGYTGVHGIDLLSSKSKRWNRFMREVLGIEETRFFAYEGGHLPMADQSFDVVFSQQVLEHVNPAFIDLYYAEEARVLKPTGLVFHQVPHRLVPYESHTKLWFLHYLPYRLWRWLLRRIGKSSIVSEEALFLRWPWVHRRCIKGLYQNNEDLTVERLVGFDDFTGYDGPVRIRRLISYVVQLPVIGTLVSRVLRNLVMIDTLSRKPL